MKHNIIKIAVLDACATALYVVAIASFLFYAPKVLGPGRANTVLVPIVMLLLLVFSAALTGFLIFGKPVLWYLDGKKKEALSLLAYTLGALFVFTVLALFTLYLTA